MDRNRKDQLDFSADTKKFLRELFGESIGSPSAEKKLDAIIEMLHPISELPLMNSRLETIHGLIAGGSNSPEALTAINNLTNLVKEIEMGLKEDFQTLTERFDRLDEAALAVADDIAALKNEIKEANDRANIDLTPLVTRAEGIESRMRASAGPNAGSDPDAPPVEPPVEPPPEG